MSAYHATKTHCINGHLLSPDNIKKLTNGSGHRICKTCHRETAAAYRAAHRKPRKAAADRFFEKVEKTETCWLWLGGKCGGKDGDYGAFRFDGKQGYAHRFSYELKHGPIAHRLQIDHLCRNRSCVNPDHLEAVTQKDNLLRGLAYKAINYPRTHCTKGHEFTPENTRMEGGIYKRCKACRNSTLPRKIHKL